MWNFVAAILKNRKSRRITVKFASSLIPKKNGSHWMTPTDYLWFPKVSIRLPTKILDLLAKKISPITGGLSWQTHGSSSVQKSPKLSPSKGKTSSEFTWIFIREGFQGNRPRFSATPRCFTNRFVTKELRWIRSFEKKHHAFLWFHNPTLANFGK